MWDITPESLQKNSAIYDTYIVTKEVPLYVEVSAKVSEKGSYGHMGMMPREIEVKEYLSYEKHDTHICQISSNFRKYYFCNKS